MHLCSLCRMLDVKVLPSHLNLFYMGTYALLFICTVDILMHFTIMQMLGTLPNRIQVQNCIIELSGPWKGGNLIIHIFGKELISFLIRANVRAFYENSDLI